MENEKQRWEESETGRAEESRSEKRKSEKKEDAGARKSRKVAKHCVFPMICGSVGPKSRLAKAAGTEPCGQMRDEKLHAVAARSTFSKSKCTKHTRFEALSEVEMSKKCTPLWREAHLEVKSVKKLTVSGHLWKLRCRKSAHRCGTKHIWKSKCTKHFSFGSLLKVEMSKKCTPLWRETRFHVKTRKAHHARTTFGS